MEKYPAYDPPEYVSWRADAELVREYEERLGRNGERWRRIESLDEAGLLGMYAGLLRNRLHDIALKRWVRQGVLSKAWLGSGEEAVTVGAVHALDPDRDVVAPMIRNAGACHEMGMSVEAMLRGYLGTADGPTGGRDLHVGDPNSNVVAPISPVGEMVPVITGIALAFRQRGESRVALTWVGDGATKTAAFHEGVNLAGVLRAPAIFIIQNNQVALGTRLDDHQHGDFDDWARMYGVAGGHADGNNVLDVYGAVHEAAERARSGGGPSLLVVDTFRMGGHATHDEAEARATFPASLFEEWGRRDPIGLYEEYLLRTGIGRERLRSIEERVAAEVDRAAERALESRDAALPTGVDAECAGMSAGHRQPGLSERLEHGLPRSSGNVAVR